MFAATSFFTATTRPSPTGARYTVPNAPRPISVALLSSAFLDMDVEAGTIPESWFLDSLRYLSALRSPSESGKLPVSALSDKSRCCTAASLPSQAGTSPESRLPDAEK